MRCFSSFPVLSLLIPNPPFTSAIYSLYKSSCFNHRIGITVTGQSFMHSFAEHSSQQGPAWRCRFHSLFWWREYWLPWSAHLPGTQKSNFLALIVAVSCTEALQSYLGEDGRGWREPQQLQLLCPEQIFCSKGGSFSPTFPGNEHLVLCSSLVTQAYP